MYGPSVHVFFQRSAMKNSAFVFIKPHAVTPGVKKEVKKTFEAKGITVLSEGSIDSEVNSTLSFLNQTKLTQRNHGRMPLSRPFNT